MSTWENFIARWSRRKREVANDPAAKKVLDDVSAKFKTYKTVQATFVYKVEDGNGKVMSTKTGTIWMKGTKYKVVFGGQEIYSDGKTVWN